MSSQNELPRVKLSFYLYITFAILAVGCEKEYVYKEQVPTQIDSSKLVGDYEWSWSKLPNGAIIESTTSQLNYGFRIKASGYIYSFSDGIEINKFSFEEYFSQWGKTGIKTYQNENYDQLNGLYYEDEMQVLNFPFSGFLNYFYKHE